MHLAPRPEEPAVRFAAFTYKWDLWFQECGNAEGEKHNVSGVDDSHALRLIKEALQKNICCVAIQRSVN